jgi:hypothetical protein
VGVEKRAYLCNQKKPHPGPPLKGKEKPTPEPLPKRRGDGKEKREGLRVIYI